LSRIRIGRLSDGDGVLSLALENGSHWFLDLAHGLCNDGMQKLLGWYMIQNVTLPEKNLPE
jgi:hypothetical protein